MNGIRRHLSLFAAALQITYEGLCAGTLSSALMHSMSLCSLHLFAGSCVRHGPGPLHSMVHVLCCLHLADPALPGRQDI